MKCMITTTFLSLVLTFAVAQKKYTKSFDESSIPSDLKAKGHILIVHAPFLESEEKKNAAIREAFEKNYTGKFVVIASESKEWDNPIYEDTKIYKYSISMLQTRESHMINNNPKTTIEHINYEISIVDRARFNKTHPRAVKDSLEKANGGKKLTLEQYKKAKAGDYDISAFSKTGLSDREAKLDDMLAFLAGKLEAF